MEKKRIPYLIATVPILFLIVLLSINIVMFEDALGGSNQLALLFSGALASITGIKYGTKWSEIIDGISNSIKSVAPAIIILLLIGALAGTWLLSGIVPTMIYYGLKILNPEIFLFATAIITAIVSISTGSSWSTIATIGVALLGIGQALGLPVGLIGGAIISGAYFGDKMSPLSDTTNLAPAMAGTDLITHIRYMMYTTIPSFIITLIIFLVIGFNFNSVGTQNIDELLNSLQSSINITPWLFLVPVMVIFLIVKKMAAIPSLFIGSLLGGVFAVLFQPEIIMTLTGSDTLNFQSSYVAVINAMTIDTNIVTDNQQINDLLSTSGMYGMLNTILLIVCAMIFGGALEVTGILKRMAEPIIKYAESTGSLIATTAGTCIFFNITTSDQYLSIVVPGRMFADTYKEKGLAPENLSRTLEDSGTVTSVLVPWNSCGATQSAVLGVATLTYLPFCFFNLISPLMTIAYGYFGIKIKKLEKNIS